jgi:hypothetical protein
VAATDGWAGGGGGILGRKEEEPLRGQDRRKNSDGGRRRKKKRVWWSGPPGRAHLGEDARRLLVADHVGTYRSSPHRAIYEYDGSGLLY